MDDQQAKSGLDVSVWPPGRSASQMNNRAYAASDGSDGPMRVSDDSNNDSNKRSSRYRQTKGNPRKGKRQEGGVMSSQQLRTRTHSRTSGTNSKGRDLLTRVLSVVLALNMALMFAMPLGIFADDILPGATGSGAVIQTPVIEDACGGGEQVTPSVVPESSGAEVSPGITASDSPEASPPHLAAV